MLRVMIVDDERLSRELLRRLLADHLDVEVVAEYGSGTHVVEGIREHAPDVVFLDVQMPGRTGMEVVEALPVEALPRIVFVTAFAEYAVRAFGVRALDYLLKPLDPERLAESLRRARAASAPAAEGDAAGLAAAVDLLRAREQGARRLAIRVGDRTYLKRIEEVDWIEADGKFVQVHVGGKKYGMRETMKNMEQRLPSDTFVRVSRSAIVNLDRVREVQPWFAGDYVLILESGAQVTSTRSFRDAVAAFLE